MTQIILTLEQNHIDQIANVAAKKLLANLLAGPSISKSFPKIGEFWPEQGGYLGAIMRGKDTPDYCLIVSDKEHEFTAEFGSRGKEIATSDWDGFANTQLMIKASTGSYPAHGINTLMQQQFNVTIIPAQQPIAAEKNQEPEHFFNATEDSHEQAMKQFREWFPMEKTG